MFHFFFFYRYQQILHRNLVYLATIADSNQNMQSLLPAVSHSWGFRKYFIRLILLLPSSPKYCHLADNTGVNIKSGHQDMDDSNQEAYSLNCCFNWSTMFFTSSLPLPTCPWLLEEWVKVGHTLQATSMTTWHKDCPPHHWCRAKWAMVRSQMCILQTNSSHRGIYFPHKPRRAWCAHIQLHLVVRPLSRVPLWS